LFKSLTLTSIVVLMLSSVSPSLASLGEGYYMEGDYYIADESLVVSDDEGYFVKALPPTTEGDRANLTDKVTHEVSPGETISGIAYRYGLKSSTVLWENNLNQYNYLKVGQALTIPPVDGVTHKIAKGETLEKVAKKYEVETKVITKFNDLEEETLEIGKEVFVPGGKKAEPINRYTAYSRGRSDRSYYQGGAIADVNYIPVGNKPFIFPTTGRITQGFRRGHYALDVGNRSKPAIWSAGAGTVVKAAGGWSGGYGNHVIVDHGNGLQTLYAHMEYYTVNQGDYVRQGQVIGKMGATGRVYGVTGIHLHWEVRQNGVKQYPGNYY